MLAWKMAQNWAAKLDGKEVEWSAGKSVVQLVDWKGGGKAGMSADEMAESLDGLLVAYSVEWMVVLWVGLRVDWLAESSGGAMAASTVWKKDNEKAQQTADSKVAN